MNEEDKMYNIIVDMIYQIWVKINFADMQKSRLMRIYDEISSKIKYAACTQKISQFMSKLAQKMGIRSFSLSQELIDQLKEFNDNEILRKIRTETQYIVVLLRLKIEENKKNRKELNKGAQSLWPT